MLKVNKLSLSIKKSKYMIFNAKKIKMFQNLTLTIENININNIHNIERVAEFKFLGLSLDEHLTLICHIYKLSNKISQWMGILSRLKHILPI